jgi:hypothetical protein
MTSLQGFDATAVEPTTPIEPVPSGKYIAMVIESENKPTKAGTGHYLQLTFEILEGDYKGRLLWARLNLDNPNAQAVSIARAELSSICRAVGVMQPNDSMELHNLPMVISVRCRKRSDSDEMSNEIRGYARKEAAGVGVQSGTHAPPWNRTA